MSQTLDKVILAADRIHNLRLRSDTSEGMMQGAIVQVMQKDHDVDLTNDQAKVMRSFVGRFIEDHPEYDLNHCRGNDMLRHYPVFNQVVDIAYLTTILKGFTPIITGVEGEVVERRIGWHSPGDKKSDGSIAGVFQPKPTEERCEDLYLLSKKQIGTITFSNHRYNELQRGQLEIKDFLDTYDVAYADSKSRRTDNALFRLMTRLDSRTKRALPRFKRKRVKLPRYLQVIDMVGHDKSITRYFGHPINTTMIRECARPAKQLVLPFMEPGYDVAEPVRVEAVPYVQRDDRTLSLVA